MEDFYSNNTSGEMNYDHSNISFDHNEDVNMTDFGETILNVVDWIIICSGLPLILVAIAAFYSLIRKDHVAPVYIINLLISDFIQVCCMTALKVGQFNSVSRGFYNYSVLTSVGFMVCISLERYLVITQPLWYRFRRNIKTSVVVSVLVWILPLVCVLPEYFNVDYKLKEIIYAVYFLLPLPLFIFFLVGSIKAPSAARSVPADEKQRIVAVLVVVLLIYTLLFLPYIICSLVEEARYNYTLRITLYTFLRISPLADLTLYVFIRKGVVDKLLTSLCCC